MHNLLKTRFSHQEHAHALKDRAEVMKRQATAKDDPPAAQDAATASTKRIVTKTVVVKVPPSTTASQKLVATPTPPATPTSVVVALPASTTPSSTTSSTPTSTRTSSTSSTPSTTPKAPTTKADATSKVVIKGSTTPSTTPSAVATGGTRDGAADASSAKGSGGLSKGATGGIIAGIVLAALVVIVFVVRKTFIRRRHRKRNTWGAGLYPSHDEKPLNSASPMMDEHAPHTASDVVPTPFTSSSFGNIGTGYGGGLTPRTAEWQQDATTLRPPVTPGTAMMSPQFVVTPPPMTYNNAVPEDVYGGMAGGATMAGSANGGGNNATGTMALVKVVYAPTLPDELSVTAGEHVRVVREFDDGWCLCQNSRGEQGVVPLECLDRTQSAGQKQTAPGGYGQEGGDWRNMKRFSSLSGQAPHY